MRCSKPVRNLVPRRSNCAMMSGKERRNEFLNLRILRVEKRDRPAHNPRLLPLFESLLTMNRTLACSYCLILGAVGCAIADDVQQVSRETIRVPMRDGVMLATDIYRTPSVDRAPVLLMRTPYNKDGAKSAAERYAAAGYIAVVQDCRGRFQSDGDFFPYNSEGQDGYDAIEWLGKQSWCNGRIGMWGGVVCGRHSVAGGR